MRRAAARHAANLLTKVSLVKSADVLSVHKALKLLTASGASELLGVNALVKADDLTASGALYLKIVAFLTVAIAVVTIAITIVALAIAVIAITVAITAAALCLLIGNLFNDKSNNGSGSGNNCDSCHYLESYAENTLSLIHIFSPFSDRLIFIETADILSEIEPLVSPEFSGHF